VNNNVTTFIYHTTDKKKVLLRRFCHHATLTLLQILGYSYRSWHVFCTILFIIFQFYFGSFRTLSSSWVSNYHINYITIL